MKRDEEHLLPWYLNGTLSDQDRKRVEAWLAETPDSQRLLERYRRLHLAILHQPQSAPSSELLENLLSQQALAGAGMTPVAAGRPAPRNTVTAWSFGLLVSLLCVLVLWAVLQPGIVLNWSVMGQPGDSFRIYRAEKESQQFSLVGEVTADSGAGVYTYVDPFLRPGAEYIYRVEAIDEAGAPVTAQVAAKGDYGVLWMQLSIVLISLLAGYSLSGLFVHVRWKRIAPSLQLI